MSLSRDMLTHRDLFIFDLDGTLVDSEDFIVWSFVEAGRVVGVEVDVELVKRSIGMPLEEVVEVVLSGLGRDVVERFIDVRRRLVSDNWRSMVRLYPDVEPVLRVLRDSGFTLAVASSSVLERVIGFLEYFGVLGYFKYVSGMRPGLRGKPEPDLIIDVLASTGFNPSEAIYVGDREVDCIAARRAGVEFIYLDRKRYDYRSTCRPLFTINSLYDLLPYIKTINPD